VVGVVGEQGAEIGSYFVVRCEVVDAVVVGDAVEAVDDVGTVVAIDANAFALGSDDIPYHCLEDLTDLATGMRKH